EWLERWARRAGYELLEQIGRGPVGEVYRIRQITLKRELALKVLRPGLQEGDAAIDALRAQAQGGSAGSTNPHIAPDYHLGEGEGLDELIMEYVRGGNLTRLIERAPDPATAAALVHTLAEALHAAHQNGHLHGNLKPTNVLLTPDGVPKLSDFHLAHDAPGQTAAPDAEPYPDGACYLAPEQILGRPERVHLTTDV